MELRRDPIRLAFALLGPILLMITCGYGISFDVEHLSYAVLDRDQSPESRDVSGAVCRLALLPRAATHGALRRDGAGGSAAALCKSPSRSHPTLAAI